MKKTLIPWAVLSAIIMLILPWWAASFVKSDAGMAVCLILFFAVNPVYSVIIGIVSGKDVKHLWSLPVISPVLFLAGTWIFLDMGELSFLVYTVVYLMLGICAMAISMLITKHAVQ